VVNDYDWNLFVIGQSTIDMCKVFTDLVM